MAAFRRAAELDPELEAAAGAALAAAERRASRERCTVVMQGHRGAIYDAAAHHKVSLLAEPCCFPCLSREPPMPARYFSSTAVADALYCSFLLWPSCCRWSPWAACPLGWWPPPAPTPPCEYGAPPLAASCSCWRATVTWLPAWHGAPVVPCWLVLRWTAPPGCGSCMRGWRAAVLVKGQAAAIAEPAQGSCSRRLRCLRGTAAASAVWASAQMARCWPREPARGRCGCGPPPHAASVVTWRLPPAARAAPLAAATAAAIARLDASLAGTAAWSLLWPSLPAEACWPLPRVGREGGLLVACTAIVVTLNPSCTGQGQAAVCLLRQLVCTPVHSCMPSGPQIYRRCDLQGVVGRKRQMRGRD